jgi:hypothetical protein
MADLVSEFMKQFGPDVSRGLAANLGLDQKAATQVVPQVVPMILGGLKRQMETRGGPERIDHILNKYGNEDVLGRIGDVMSSKSREPSPDPQLGGLLGPSGAQASELIGRKFGLSPEKAMSLIPMLAPLVLGFLSKQKNQPGGAGLGGITSLIDRDGDGSILDDIVGFLSPALEGGASGGKGGLLGSLLGGLFGRKR